MSRFVLSFTLVASLGLVSVALVRRGGPTVHGAEAAPAGAGKPARIHGFPHEKGIVLLLRNEPSWEACEGTRFRMKSPEFVLWDDGTVVYRTASYDYRKGRIGRERARLLARAFETEASRNLEAGCDRFRRPPPKMEATVIEGRVRGEMDSLRVIGLEHFGGTHAEACEDCRPFVPLARLAGELREHEEAGDPLMSGLPVEVRLQRKSCGCRDYPEIASASSAWPIAGPGPAEICRSSGGIVVLRERAEIERVAASIERSAAVVEGTEIYTCFMRPLLEVR
jgi:hypothetical protein